MTEAIGIALRGLLGLVLILVATIVWAAMNLWTHRLEAIAAAFGLAGAWLLASKGDHAAFAWWCFLASNAGWIAFGYLRRHWFLLLQQAGFTASSLVGIWNYTP